MYELIHYTKKSKGEGQTQGGAHQTQGSQMFPPAPPPSPKETLTRDCFESQS